MFLLIYYDAFFVLIGFRNIQLHIHNSKQNSKYIPKRSSFRAIMRQIKGNETSHPHIIRRRGIRKTHVKHA